MPGDTGHAEVVQVQFENSMISFEQLCLIFLVYTTLPN